MPLPSLAGCDRPLILYLKAVSAVNTIQKVRSFRLELSEPTMNRFALTCLEQRVRHGIVLVRQSFSKIN